MSTVEQRLREAMLAAADLVEESPDLFARVTRSIEEQGERLQGQAARNFLLVVAAQGHEPHVHGFRHGSIMARRWA